MRRPTNRFLAVLLMLLLGLAPFQATLAGLVVSLEQKAAVHQMDRGDNLVAVTDHVGAQDCGPCDTGANCSGQDCASGHCASCGLMLLSCLAYAGNPGANPVYPLPAHGPLSHRVSLPFRPPRL